MSLMHSSRPHDRNCQRLERTSSSRAEVQGSARPFAVAFAQAGAKSVAIVGRRLDRLETAAEAIKAAAGPSTQVFLETGDVTKRESVETARRDIVNKVGRIDIFVANAGVLPREAPVVGYDEADLRYSLETNVLGPFNSLQAFRRWAAPGAKLFNIGSSIGHWAPLPEVPGAFGYAAAKAAALKMFDYFAFENPDIHVVTVHPGIIATEINPNITVGADTVQLPAHFLVWLASEEAKFLDGKFVWANWDAQELMTRAEEIRTSLLLRVTLKGVDM